MIIRTSHNKENPYVLINKNSLWDPELSLEAVGLWARLLSRPDNWVFHTSEIRKSCNIGKDKLYRILNELMEKGYAYRYQPLNDKGQFSSYETIVFEHPMTKEQIKEMFPHADFALPTNRAPLNPPLLSKDKIQNTEKNVCYPPADDQKISSLEKKKQRCLESPMMPKAINNHISGKTIETSIDDIFREAVRTRQNWTTAEIHDAFQVLCDYKGLVGDILKFVGGVVSNLRKEKKVDFLAKTKGNKACQNTGHIQKEKNLSDTCNESLSEPDMKERHLMVWHLQPTSVKSSPSG